MRAPGYRGRDGRTRAAGGVERFVTKPPCRASSVMQLPSRQLAGGQCSTFSVLSPSST